MIYGLDLIIHHGTHQYYFHAIHINHNSLMNASKLVFPLALYATMETLKYFFGGKERVILIMPPVAE